MFTVPDKVEGDNDIQSIWFQEYIDALVAGIQGIDCVLVGCGVTGGADMTPAVAKGAVLTNGVLKAVTAGDVTIGAAHASLPRIDLIVVDSSGAKQVRAGTAASAPKPPARSANDVLLASVYVAANDTTIGTGCIDDKRVPCTQGPIVIFKETTVRSQNTSAAAVSLFAAAPVIPNGLFLAGRILRVRTGGNVLHNTTTGMTITVIITYGGTTIFSDVALTYGTTADTDRQAWRLEFDLVASASNAQKLVGFWLAQGPTVTPPATGIGDIATDEQLGVSPIASANGGIAVDSDAADRTLDITFTMSNSNASHEWVREYVTVELL